MYLLYLDDSGSTQNASDRHIVLAGVAVFERQAHWFGERLDELASRLWPTSPDSLEFRGADILSGRKHWRALPPEVRVAAYQEALQLLGRSAQVHLFGCAVHKAAVSPDDAMEHAFEQICNRFDRFLGRLYKQNNTQRGLIILDKSSYETSLQGLATNFKRAGHSWGKLYNLAEVPLFVDSRATRMIQYADLVAHAVRRYYEKGDASLFDLVSNRFDTQGGIIHGLAHVKPLEAVCNCMACKQRRAT